MRKIIILSVCCCICFAIYDVFKGASLMGSMSKEQQFSVEEMHKGALLLINKEIATQPQTSKIVDVSKTSLLEVTEANGEVLLAEEIVSSLYEMLQAAKEDGASNVILNSGYRSFEQQQVLFEEYGSDYALPAGFSEHNSGLAIDIGSTQGTMDNTVEGEWLAENSWRYGFILRYPQHKTNVTGISYEPWHFRYVGFPHSKKMKEEDWVLEEYIQFLHDKNHYKMKIDGQKYEVHYIPVSEAGTFTINIPSKHAFTISGDNVTGVILTVIK